MVVKQGTVAHASMGKAVLFCESTWRLGGEEDSVSESMMWGDGTVPMPNALPSGTGCAFETMCPVPWGSW